MGELIGSKDSLINIKHLTDTLLARQVQEGPRRGSFNPVPNTSYYYDYTAPLALLAAYESPRTPASDKERYLQAAKKWLTRADAEQNEDGTIPPFATAPKKAKKNDDDVFFGTSEPKPDPLVEPTAGVLWVATRYQDIIKNRPDRAELAKISDPKLKEEIAASKGEEAPPAQPVDANPLDTLVNRSLASLKQSQARRSDGLFPTSRDWVATYYTADAHIHGALTSAMRAHDKNSDAYKDSKAMDDKLAQGIHGFAHAPNPPHLHLPFVKGPRQVDFQKLDGHHMIVEGYGAALSGKHQYFDKMKEELETAMGSDEKRTEFLRVQTMPAGIVAGLQGTGTSAITVNGEDMPLETVMEHQLRELTAPLYPKDPASPPVAVNEHLHKVAFACMTGYQGCDWLPALGEYKGPVKEQSMFAAPSTAPFGFPKTANPEGMDAGNSLDPVEFDKANPTEPPKESQPSKFPVSSGDEPPDLSVLPAKASPKAKGPAAPSFPR